MSYCNRFLLSKKDISRHLVQVVLVTCLLIASTIFEARPIKLVRCAKSCFFDPDALNGALMNYTQGKYNRREVLTLEGELLASLGSYLHPPTAGSFCLIFMSRFSSFPMPVASAIDTCHFMIKLAACSKREAFFVIGMVDESSFASYLNTLFRAPWQTSFSCLTNNPSWRWPPSS
jgi:hypothetical protein